jgi:8-oxo-dGTP pyrophosphatase MutT (NUDIX family)
MNYLDYYKELQKKEAPHRDALWKTGFWGKQGAGCIFLARDTGRICLQLRGQMVEEPLTWGSWGGAIDDNENPTEAVKREVREEAGYHIGKLNLIPLATFSHRDFKYYNFLAIVDEEFDPYISMEVEDFQWFRFGHWPSSLHFGLKYLISQSGDEIQKIIAQL